MADFDKKLILLYTSIGFVTTLINLLITGKNFIKSILQSKIKNVLAMLVLLIAIIPIIFLGYWYMYVLSYSIAQEIFKSDFIVMHLVANTPTIVMLIFSYKGYKN